MTMMAHRMMAHYIVSLARDNFGPNQPAVIEDCGIQRLMCSADNPGHLNEIVRGRTFDATYMHWMHVRSVVEPTRRFGAKVCPRIRVKASGLVMILQSASPADRCHFGRARGDRDGVKFGIQHVTVPQIFNIWSDSDRSVQPITLGSTVATDRICYRKGLGGEQGSSNQECDDTE